MAIFRESLAPEQKLKTLGRMDELEKAALAEVEFAKITKQEDVIVLLNGCIGILEKASESDASINVGAFVTPLMRIICPTKDYPVILSKRKSKDVVRDMLLADIDPVAVGAVARRPDGATTKTNIIKDVSEQIALLDLKLKDSIEHENKQHDVAAVQKHCTQAIIFGIVGKYDMPGKDSKDGTEKVVHVARYGKFRTLTLKALEKHHNLPAGSLSPADVEDEQQQQPDGDDADAAAGHADLADAGKVQLDNAEAMHKLDVIVSLVASVDADAGWAPFAHGNLLMFAPVDNTQSYL